MPFSCPSAMSGRSSSISVIAASSASSASVLVPTLKSFGACLEQDPAPGELLLPCLSVLCDHPRSGVCDGCRMHRSRFIPDGDGEVLMRFQLCITRHAICPWRNLGSFVHACPDAYA